MTKDFVWDYQLNLNISGGTDFVKYFGSFAYVREGDIMNTQDLGQGYNPEFKYDRFNFRSNLDFSLTSTTNLKVNIAGYHGIQQRSNGNAYNYYHGLYDQAPDVYPVKYSDGAYGNLSDNTSPFVALNFGGYQRTNRTNVNTDFALEQKLDFILKGLSVNGKFSYDTHFETRGPNVSESSNMQKATKYIDPYLLESTGDTAQSTVWLYPSSPNNGFRYQDLQPSYSAESSGGGGNKRDRNLYYQVNLNYNRDFGQHAVTVLALLNRFVEHKGQQFASYREDWVGRITYNYDLRYFIEFNGAYNGSEKFAGKKEVELGLAEKSLKFGFFPSLALAYTVSNEDFFKNNINFVNLFKMRYSYGQVGSDSYNGRWAFIQDWNIQQGVFFGEDATRGYSIWSQGAPPNALLQWEVAEKQNVGLETGFWDNLITINYDYFWEKRDNIIMNASQRTETVPIIFGAEPVAGNIGQTKTHGWELSIKGSKSFANLLNVWLEYTHTYVKDEIVYMEDPELADPHLMNKGFQIGQSRSYYSNGVAQSWDEIYGYALPTSNWQSMMPGSFQNVDYNADGVIDDKDIVPVGYPSRPQYTYSPSFGIDWKGLSLMIQFYGVYNTTRNFDDGKNTLNEFRYEFSNAYDHQLNDAYTPRLDNTTDAGYRHVRFKTREFPGYNSNYYMYDGSYIRLKTMELSYKFKLERYHVSSIRVFINGNNLLIWSKLPVDRESNNFTYLNYPTLRHFTFGANLSL